MRGIAKACSSHKQAALPSHRRSLKESPPPYEFRPATSLARLQPMQQPRRCFRTTYTWFGQFWDHLKKHKVASETVALKNLKIAIQTSKDVESVDSLKSACELAGNLGETEQKLARFAILDASGELGPAVLRDMCVHMCMDESSLDDVLEYFQNNDLDKNARQNFLQVIAAPEPKAADPG